MAGHLLVNALTAWNECYLLTSSTDYLGCNPKWREGYSGRRIALCEEEMEVQFGGQCSELIDFHHLYLYHTAHGIPCLENCGVQGNHSPAGGV
jgi:hypothetical protein